LEVINTEELHNLYSPPYVTCVMKSRRMRWAGHVAYDMYCSEERCVRDFGWETWGKATTLKT